jgi:hypothetical protein
MSPPPGPPPVHSYAVSASAEQPLVLSAKYRVTAWVTLIYAILGTLGSFILAYIMVNSSDWPRGKPLLGALVFCLAIGPSLLLLVGAALTHSGKRAGALLSMLVLLLIIALGVYRLSDLPDITDPRLILFSIVPLVLNIIVFLFNMATASESGPAFVLANDSRQHSS